jgi:nucleoside-diphosphate-sugar epimerase
LRVKPTKILITGATGFIGSRLCEMLTLDHHVPYRALVRNFSRAGRIARMNAEMVAGDTLDAKSLELALQGCDAVVHLAHSDDRTAAKQAELLVAACRKANVARFVHVSSMAVHGPSPGLPVLTEANAPIRRWGEVYSDAKAATESVVMRAFEKHDFPVVVLRPTIVYGPYSFFVTPIVEDARRGHVSLVDGGRGHCNAVYVDDVCDAVMAALANDSVVGEAFLVNGDCRIEWREFIGAFASMVPRSTQTFDHSAQEIEAYWRAREPRARDSLRAIVKLAASTSFHSQLATVPPVGNLIRRSKELLSSAISDEQKAALKTRFQGRKSAAQADAAPSIKVPNRGRVIREAYRSWVANDLAKTRLGWSPRFTFERGAARTGEWLRFAKMLSAV